MVSYRLIRAAGVVHQRFSQALEACGLSPLQHATLAWVQARGPINQKSLAALVNVDAGDLVRHLDSLQQRALVLRERDAKDRRRQIITLTGSGAELLLEAGEKLSAVEADCFRSLSGASQQVLSDLSTSIYLDSTNGQHPSPMGGFEVIGGRSALRAGKE